MISTLGGPRFENVVWTKRFKEGEVGYVSGTLWMRGFWHIDRPIKDARVVLYIDGLKYAEDVTNENGEFEFYISGSSVGVGVHMGRLVYPDEGVSYDFQFVVEPGTGSGGVVYPSPAIDLSKYAKYVVAIGILAIGSYMVYKVATGGGVKWPTRS